MNKQLLKIALAVGVTTVIPLAQGAGTEQVQSTDPALYRSECGACHVAYPPDFLPARSWEKLMSDLKDHFGDNAELADEEVRALTAYLTENAADRGQTKRGTRVMRSLKTDELPLRLTELTYFKRLHHEVPKKLVKDNPEVKSFSRCDACHTRALEGSFKEGEVQIPGRGRWED